MRILLASVRFLPMCQEVAPHGRLRIDELQEIHQVRCRTQYGTAVIALAIVHRSEQRFHRREVLDQLIFHAFPHLHWSGYASNGRLAIELLGNSEQVARHTAHLLRLSTDELRYARRRGLLVDLFVLGMEQRDELLFGVRHHVEGGRHAEAHQDRHRLIAGGDLIHPLHHPHLLAGLAEFRLAQAIEFA